jgi:hypothetical protein
MSTVLSSFLQCKFSAKLLKVHIFVSILLVHHVPPISKIISVCYNKTVLISTKSADENRENTTRFCTYDTHIQWQWRRTILIMSWKLAPNRGTASKNSIAGKGTQPKRQPTLRGKRHYQRYSWRWQQRICLAPSGQRTWTMMPLTQRLA